MKVKDILGVLLVTFLIVTGLAVAVMMMMIECL